MDSPSDDEIIESQEQDQQLEDSSTSAEDVNTEDSSTSEESEEISTFDVVKAALDKKDESEDEESDSEDDDSKEPDEDDPGDDEQSDEPTEEELKRWKPKTRKRFEELQSRYRETKERLEAVETDAGHYKNFVSFLETNRISTEQANELFEVGALLVNDPFKALAKIQPVYENLLRVTGAQLPPDLQQQVQQGYITEQHARELSQHRARTTTQQSIAEQQAQYQQQQQVQHQQQVTAQLQGAMATWEKQWSQSDPDYGVKKAKVLDRVELLLSRASREGNVPTTVEQAINLANEAKSQVEAEIKQYQPKRPVNTVEGSRSGSSRPQPKNTLDVIKQTLGQ